jgi:hypothetical protein
MSHVGHPTLSNRSQLRANWLVAVSALLALIAAAAVTLVLVIDNGPSTATSPVAKPQAAVRSDGGPNESAVAASIAPRPSAGPDESAVAASIAPRPSASPDESNVAASIGGPRMLPTAPDDSAIAGSGPDESAVAASIAGH